MDESEKEQMLIPEGEYPVWTPLGAFEAARILQDALEADKWTIFQPKPEQA